MMLKTKPRKIVNPMKYEQWNKLNIKEIDYILSLVEFKAYETTIYSIEEANFLEEIINKLHYQKEALEKGSER